MSAQLWNQFTQKAVTPVTNISRRLRKIDGRNMETTTYGRVHGAGVPDYNDRVKQRVSE